MGKRKTFDDWLLEVREITKDVLEMSLDEMPEFDVTDARSYHRNGDSPSCYFRECLSEHVGDDVKRLEEIMGGSDAA